MRWIQIGERAHAVLRKNKGLTLCRLEIVRAKSIVVSPPFEERCVACDKEWRRRGRAQKKHTSTPKRANDLTMYKPQHTFDEWENA